MLCFFKRVYKPFAAQLAQPLTLRSKLVIGRPPSKIVSPKPKKKRLNPSFTLTNHCVRKTTQHAETATALPEVFSAMVTKIVMMALTKMPAMQIQIPIGPHFVIQVFVSSLIVSVLKMEHRYLANSARLALPAQNAKMYLR